MTNVGIVGSRRRNSSADKEQLLNWLHENKLLSREFTQFISGGCPSGADKFAEEIAKEHGVYIEVFRADWARYRGGAGKIRNQDIAEHCDLLVALVADDRTGGTEHTIGLVEGLNKPVYVLEKD